ncbi:MAG: AAA family ATPase [Rhizobacter sp.]|nr:AAA family ATPase [Rhizobacter sp.]
MATTIPGIAAPVEGSSPIVVIGPNGVGKTHLGVAISNANQGERVAALRNVEIPDIPMQTLQQASQQVKQALAEVLHQHWRQSFELQHLMAEILAEDRERAVVYRHERENNPEAKVDQSLTNTRLTRIVRIWNRHFPGRKINVDYQPMVERVKPDGTVAKYSISRMSEGERTAFYLAARVVSCDKGTLVVDEPETFFHPLLARRLWDDLESEAPNVRFVYITHDIAFALSRKAARFAIARSESSADLLPPTASIPAEIITEVLGAASFSISASRLIFCEGKAQSLDLPVLSAWHNCAKTAIVPVGGCDSVRECVSVFRANQITGGLEAYGYVDRDAWPESYLSSAAFVKPHAVSEIEGLFCIKAVFLALAKFNGSSDPEAATQFAAFAAEARSAFTGAALNKEILNRSKRRVEIEQKALLNPIKNNPDLETVRSGFCGVAPTGGWTNYLTLVFSEEELRLKNSLNGADDAFLKDLPAKSYFATAAKHLKFVPEKMVETLCNALKLQDADAATEERLRALRDAIIPAIEPFMWPRHA